MVDVRVQAEPQRFSRELAEAPLRLAGAQATIAIEEDLVDLVRREGVAGAERAIFELEQSLARDEAILREDWARTDVPSGDAPGVRMSEEEWIARAQEIEAQRDRIRSLKNQLRDLRVESGRTLGELETAANATALQALDESARRVESERARYGITREAIIRPPRGLAEGGIDVRHHLIENEETERLRRAAGELEAARLALEAAERRQQAAVLFVPVKRAGGEIDARIIYTAEHPALVAETDRLQRAYDLLRFEKEREHPVLAAFAEERGAHSLGVIARGTIAEAAGCSGACSTTETPTSAR